MDLDNKKPSGKKYFLVYHTIFILNENIKWLEEYLIYYIHLGFEHFYLYDNTGSIGCCGSTPTKNKYGFEIVENEHNISLFNNILKKYETYITYIKWQPLDKSGRIIYGQPESIYHFKTNYAKYSEYCAFMDLDEFLYSENDINLKDYLIKKREEGINCVQLYQKKFKDRHNIKESRITYCYDCLVIPYRKDYGIKNIIETKYLSGCSNKGGGIHNLYCSGKKQFANPNDLRFNHYNISHKQVNFINKMFKKNYDIHNPEYTIDNGMKKFKYLFDS
jgi:hypothetical protein